MSQRSRRSQAKSLNTSSQGQSSQNSRRSTQRAASPPDENYDEYTVATVKFILNHLATKYPIKRADIVKECCNGNTKILTIILPVVQNHLKSVYGIIFQEVNSSKAGNKLYISCSHIPQISLLQLKKSDSKDQSLLLLILSYIFIKGTCIGEGVLFNFLARLEIDIDREHEYFGDVKKSLEIFRKQLYIKRDKKVSEASNEEKITIEWGERASMEFNKKTMLIEVAQVFHKPTLFFKKQHMELMNGEESMDVSNS